jgi:hypothetical protein
VSLEQVYSLVQEIDAMLSSVEEKTTNLEAKVPMIEESSMTLQQATRIAFRFNHILSHMGLPENIQQSIQILQKMVFMLRMVEMSATFLAGGTPYGLIMGGLGAISVILSTSSIGSGMAGYEATTGV